MQAIRLLVVDDEPALARLYQGVLVREGWTVETASSGIEAAARVKEGSFDAILSDISMPGMTGLEFLHVVRQHDVDVPVILMTGQPDLASAMRAVEYGAFRYLAKPVDLEELPRIVSRAATLHKLARLKNEALRLPGGGGQRLGETAALEVRFEWGMSLLWMAFQPIVSWGSRTVFGYEALLRTDEPLMRNPAQMLDAADRLGKVHELGRAIRAKVAAEASRVADPIKLFVNLHSSDLNDEALYSPDSPLSRIANRVVLEITERASLHGVKNLAARMTSLRHLGFEIAIDDLGAGYAGLTSFTQLDPEIAKLDMSLVRGIDVDERRQSIVRSIKRLCDELRIAVVVEGIETPAEREMLVRLGCDTFQGYLFAKPEKGFPEPRW